MQYHLNTARLARAIFWPLVALLGLQFQACELTRTIDADFFPFEGPHMVCFAYIGHDEPVQVFLFPTSRALDTTRAQPIADAEVDLYVDGVFHERLVLRDGHFESPTMLLGQAGRSYHLTARADGYPDINTLPVTVPAAPVLDVHEWGYSEDSLRVWIALDVTHPPLEGFFPGVQVNGYRDGVLVRSGLNTDNLERQPIGGNTVRRVFSVRRATVVYEGFIPVGTVAFDRLEIEGGLFSDHIYQFRDSRPDGDLGGFFPAEGELFSNVVGGYGIVGAYATNSIVIDLP